MHAWHVTWSRFDVGLVRRLNEDRYHADPAAGIFVVCDGMGESIGPGKSPAAASVETIAHHLAEAETDRSPVDRRPSRVSSATNRLASAVRLANHRVHQEAARRTEYAGWGRRSSQSGLLVVLSIAHVGDSRLYLIRDGAVQLLTVDHSLVQEQMQIRTLGRCRHGAPRIDMC